MILLWPKVSDVNDCRWICVCLMAAPSVSWCLWSFQIHSSIKGSSRPGQAKSSKGLFTVRRYNQQPAKSVHYKKGFRWLFWLFWHSEMFTKGQTHSSPWGWMGGGLSQHPPGREGVYQWRVASSHVCWEGLFVFFSKRIRSWSLSASISVL